MQIDKHTVVSLHYKLQKGDAEGELIEETAGGDPLTFLYGVGQMIPEFEKQLAGKQAGEDFAFGIASTDAYGEYDPEAVGALPKSAFIIDGQLAEDMLVEGRVLPLRDPDNNLVYGTVMEVKPEEVILNFNHPMAGVDLYFTGTVETVRAATSDEIDHGHVHGPGGHHHH